MAQLARNKNLNLDGIQDGSALYQSVQIIIDPRAQDLDKTIRDVLQISRIISGRLPTARITSIAVNDYFATAKVTIPDKPHFKVATVRLYEIEGVWKIRGKKIT